MLSQTLAITVFSVLGAGCGPLIAQAAARRAAAQPLPVDSDAERRLLAAVAASPERTVEAFEATQLTGEHFAHPGRGVAWDAIATAHADDPDAAATAKLEAAARIVSGNSSAAEQLDAAIRAAAGDDPHGDGPLRDDDAALVVLDAEDRSRYRGDAPIVATGGEEPLKRVWRAPTFGRHLFAGVATAAGFALSVWLVGGATDFTGASAGWAVAALCATVVVGLFVAFVDHDTLYLDHLGFWTGSAVAWAFAVAACLTGGVAGQLIVGVVAAVLWAVVFESLNLAYKLLRGMAGIGLGDTFIVLCCTGVPAAISGSLLVGVTTVAAGAMLAAVVSVPLLITRRRDRQTPFALGPYLAVGWLLCWPLLWAAGATTGLL